MAPDALAAIESALEALRADVRASGVTPALLTRATALEATFTAAGIPDQAFPRALLALAAQKLGAAGAVGLTLRVFVGGLEGTTIATWNEAADILKQLDGLATSVLWQVRTHWCPTSSEKSCAPALLAAYVAHIGTWWRP